MHRVKQIQKFIPPTSMEQLNENKLSTPKWFALTGLALLVLGMLFGVVGALQYVVPGFSKTYLSFEKIRPLHVSSVVFWILFAAMGSTLIYLKEHFGEIYSKTLTKIQLGVFLIAIILILGCYFFGFFGGREYWEFPPILAILIMLGWLLFAINVVKTAKSMVKQPVYVWMWITGAIGFLITFSESYLWIFPYFQRDIVRDMTVQWKSYGSMVGCWNMLVYGASIFLMEKINKDKSYAYSKIAFALFFLGLFNLLFNWSHHIYTLPVASPIKHVGYLVSMTELFILGRIIYKWKGTVTQAQKFNHLIPYRFLLAADLWIFLNLFLAILMSIPAINVNTHGTHITVAHAMGTTIGINTMILMAICFDVFEDRCQNLSVFKRQIAIGYSLLNGSLMFFFIALIAAGIQRSQWQMSEGKTPFSQMMKSLTPYFIIFLIAGGLIFIGFCLVIHPLIASLMKSYLRSTVTGRKKVEIVLYHDHDK